MFNCKNDKSVLECTLMTCNSHKNLFPFEEKYLSHLCFYYLVNREQLQKILSCLFHKNREICGFCEQCFTCARLNDFRQRLTNAYFVVRTKMVNLNRNFGGFTFLHFGVNLILELK